MKYTVVWKPHAEQELAAIWNEATDRNALTAAAHQLDQILKTNPEEAGESRSAGTRVLVEPPLVIRFSVSRDDCLVSVVAVWRLRPRGKRS